MSRIEEYLALMQERDETGATINKVVQDMQQAVNVLADEGWKRVSLPNTNIGLPVNVAMSSRRFNIGDWPSDVRSLAEDIGRWHNLSQKIRNSWHQIPEGMRRNLKGPDS